MRVCILVAVLAVTVLLMTGCIKQEEHHFIGREDVGTFIMSEGITSDYGYPKAKVVTTQGTFYVLTLMSARNGEALWIEEYNDRRKYLCSASNVKCYGLVTN